MELPHPRIYLLQRLRAELLGPRDGAEESLPFTTDPREEYTTGVLEEVDADEHSPAAVELEALEAEELELSGAVAPEDEEEHHPLRRSAGFAPSVDPRRMPRSIGISFLAESGGLGALRVALSCGRYSREEAGWVRHPMAFEQRVPLQVGEQSYTFQNQGVRLTTKIKRQAPTKFSISLFLINLGTWPGRTVRPTALIYQPQIRVLLPQGCRLAPMEQQVSRISDDKETPLQLLYRNSPVKGRGHMCASIWQEIDIEQLPGSPFGWVDETPELREFSRCDLRSELLPALSVSTPSMEWRSECGADPLRDAKTLSECCDGKALREGLLPLVKGYQAWWTAREAEAAELPESYSHAIEKHLVQGKECAERILQGIRLLFEDSQARLAFNFANRAVWEQARWQEGRALKWRPFQLGFILQCLPGLTREDSPDRDICDLLWFPTGGGKTEAYLGLTAYTLALRRLRHNDYDGVGVISRYTLRLLAIQQFRRGLKLITACEMLRVTPSETGMGWRPNGFEGRQDWLWGKHRFSIGLWLGSAVTPNALESLYHPKIPGGFEMLTRETRGEGEPAQVTECPVCAAALAMVHSEEGGNPQPLFIRIEGHDPECRPSLEDLTTSYVEVKSYRIVKLTDSLSCLELKVGGKDGRALTPALLDEWWELMSREFGEECRGLCARASRPGYFVQQFQTRRGANRDWRIEIFCPNPDCPTAQYSWREGLPVPIGGTERGFQAVHPAFASSQDLALGLSCPIPAVTVDDQIYSWPPSLLVSTVDKFARLAFEPRAACLFGNVEHYHPHEGYYREHCCRTNRDAPHPRFAQTSTRVTPLPPPDMILQDELHLIDGPLGSMVGLYETVIDTLCSGACKPKYIASTATVKEAEDQVDALFQRQLKQFPPPGLDFNDSFFALIPPPDPLLAQGAGRLYFGYCSPGRGALTPLVRVWAVILQAAQELKHLGYSDAELDPYWTPVGYFTAIRQLAGVASLWRQYIPQRLQYRAGEEARELGEALELSSRVSSQRLPGLLNKLERPLPQAVDAVFATSMFGTGVDVSRLSLMVVHDQPKTTSSYIQATGRVGRQSPGLIITTHSATRPRSLDHYEYFAGFHQQLYRGVEPVTVYPFAPRSRERAFGPLLTALLRQLSEVPSFWRHKTEGAQAMAEHSDAPEVRRILELLEARALRQPELRRPDATEIRKELEATLTRWKNLSEESGELLRFEEYTLNKLPEFPVVLGDPQHTINKLPAAFPNAPQSLREIEPTTGFQI